MTLRRFTVVAYALFAEGRDEDGIAALDNSLDPEPTDMSLERRERLRRAGVQVT